MTALRPTGRATTSTKKSLTRRVPGLRAFNIQQSSTTIPGGVYVPPSPESITHDSDGNRTSDGRWDYTWNSEGRLVQVKTSSTSGIPTNSLDSAKIMFDYDYLGRRIRKRVYATAVTPESNPSETIRYLWDGWNCIAELKGADSKFFVWGPDLSGGPQGAGGVEGLLLVQEMSAGYAVEKNPLCRL